MDTLDAWRDIIERILTTYTVSPYANAQAHTEAVFDRTRDGYVLVDVGWRGAERILGARVHVDIIEGRIWLQYDGTEHGIANELVEAGVPRDRIVLGFKLPAVRPHTGFAAWALADVEESESFSAPARPYGIMLVVVRRARSLAVAFALAACSPASPAPPAPPAASAPAPPAASASVAPLVTSAAPEVPPAPPPEGPTAAEAERILFPNPIEQRGGGCPDGDPRERIRCLIAARYEEDDAARAAALELYEIARDVAGLDEEQTMDGGYRGMLHLVPELPTGNNRRHLGWTRDAARDFEAFFAALGAPARPMRYRFRGIAFRFFRSVKARTPSAYANGWSVAYNVAGSLHVSAAAVRETLFHEIFHLNDAAHGDWSREALGGIYESIVSRCGAKTPCLAPYAPNDTQVRNGTYYAFQPGNGVHEYAAELAVRYYREHRAAQRGEKAPFPRPFKCGPDENQRAWKAIVGEFFGGVDRTPACP